MVSAEASTSPCVRRDLAGPVVIDEIHPHIVLWPGIRSRSILDLVLHSTDERRLVQRTKRGDGAEEKKRTCNGKRAAWFFETQAGKKKRLNEKTHTYVSNTNVRNEGERFFSDGNIK